MLSNNTRVVEFLIVLATLFTASYANAPNVTMIVSPRVIWVGSSVRVQCRVIRHAANIAIMWGFTDWTSTTRQLDGVTDPLVWERTFDRIPCQPGPAFCHLYRRGERDVDIQRSVMVAGCDETASHVYAHNDIR